MHTCIIFTGCTTQDNSISIFTMARLKRGDLVKITGGTYAPFDYGVFVCYLKVFCKIRVKNGYRDLEVNVSPASIRRLTAEERDEIEGTERPNSTSNEFVRVRRKQLKDLENQLFNATVKAELLAEELNELQQKFKDIKL